MLQICKPFIDAGLDRNTLMLQSVTQVTQVTSFIDAGLQHLDRSQATIDSVDIFTGTQPTAQGWNVQKGEK